MQQSYYDSLHRLVLQTKFVKSALLWAAESKGESCYNVVRLFCVFAFLLSVVSESTSFTSVRIFLVHGVQPVSVFHNLGAMWLRLIEIALCNMKRNSDLDGPPAAKQMRADTVKLNIGGRKAPTFFK